MPRQARVKSKTGIYHIMLRGIDKRDIFLDDKDKTVFLQKLNKVKDNNFSLLGYCLMNNHIHMLLKEIEEIGTSVKRFTVSYVQWHNKKYGRTGHLFQNRYLSEPIHSESYFITALRYIHQNPLRAGIVTNLYDYPWSSFRDYLSSYQGITSIIDSDLIKTYLSNQKDFEQYMNTVVTSYKEMLPQKKLSEEAIKKIINKIVEIEILLKLPVHERNNKIKEIYKSTGISIRTLAKILGMSKSKIENALK